MSRPRQKKRRKKRRTSTSLPEPKGTPEDRAQQGLNNVGTGRTRDLTMWERPTYEKTALERLRDLNNAEW